MTKNGAKRKTPLWKVALPGMMVAMLLAGCFTAQEATDARWSLVSSADTDFANSQSETLTLINDHVRVKTEVALAEKTNLYNAALADAKELPAGDERDALLAAIGADWADGKAAVVRDAGDDFLNYALILAKNEAQNQTLHATNEMADEQLAAMELDLSDFVTEETVRAVVATVFAVVERQTPEDLKPPAEGNTGKPGTVPTDVETAQSEQDKDVAALRQRLLGVAAEVEARHGGHHALPHGHVDTSGHHKPKPGHHNTNPHHK